MTDPDNTPEAAGIRVETHAGVCRMTIDRPAHHNTMTAAGMMALTRAFDALAHQPRLRAVVLTGSGERTFCAGGQLKASADGTPFDLEPERFDNPVALLFRAMDRCPVPIIGRINGSAFGGGVGLACACDIAIGVEGSSFGTTEARVGVFPLMILPLLQRVVPRRQLVEMCFYAERFPASRALALGILNEVVPPRELDTAVETALRRLGRNSPTALSIGRRALNAVADLSLSDGLNLTQSLLPLLAHSRHAKEGFRAFAEKREPRWD